jgi:hypothetical protein
MAEILSQRERHPVALEPPRFTMRTLLFVVSGLCCVFAVMAAVGMIWSVAMVLVAALVGAHVLGNSLGTRLRDRQTRELADEARAVVAPRPPPPTLAPPKLAGRTRLHRLIALATLVGAAAGADLGGALAAYTYPEAPMSAVALGVISVAVLGGFLGFGTSSFISIARQAMGEALGNHDPLRAGQTGQS